MSNTTASEKIMDRVAKLLALAEHANTPAPEAELALRQANSLITKHAIDEALLRQSQTVGERRAITTLAIVLGGGEFRPYLRTIFEAAAEALRVTVASKTVRVSDGSMDTEFHMYGASEDVAWLDMLFNMIKLQFLLKLDPKWDNSLGYDANVYNFKVAGYKWGSINQIAMDHGHESRESLEKVTMARYSFYGDVDADAKLVIGDPENPGRYDRFEVRRPSGFFHKLKAAYVRHAKAIGDDTRVATQSHQAYRLSFAESFRTRMTERFWQMQSDAESEMDTIPGAALALRDMKEDADRAMWADFPNMDPAEIARRQKAYRDQVDAERKAREDMLDAMTPKERQKFLEAEEAAERKQARADRAWAKKNTRYYYRDATADAMGRAAANSVDLTRKAGSAGAGATRGELG